MKRGKLLRYETIAMKRLVKDNSVTRVDNSCKLVVNQERKNLCVVTLTADLNIDLSSDLKSPEN